MTGREHVAEGQHLPRIAHRVLVVDTSMQVIGTTLGDTTCSCVLIQDVSITVGHASVVETIGTMVIIVAAKRERNKIQCVGLPAGTEVAIVEIERAASFVVTI